MVEEVAPMMYNLLSPAMEETTVLTFIKVYDVEHDQRIRVMDIVSLEETTVISELEKELIRDRKIPRSKSKFILY